MLNKKQNPINDIEENIKFLIHNAPFKLDITDSIVQEIGLYYLPYSTGFEIECMVNVKDINIKQKFLDIPNIIEADVNNLYEQRFRIPNGIKGIVCLFHISNLLKEYAVLNPDSGIHYHIDFTDVFDNIFLEKGINIYGDSNNFIDNNKDYILSELDKWNYKGTYNRREVLASVGSVWVRFQSMFKTMEIRIGEMTFDYSLLFKRIVHGNEIAKTLKEGKKHIASNYGQNSVDIINNRIIKI